MELEVVTIGNELLLGFTLDTNAAELSAALNAVGARVIRTTTVSDEGAAIRAAVLDGLDRTGFVVTTGGLGPTRDDITKKVIADIFDAPLELDTAYIEELRERFERLGRGPMAETNRTQAEVPRGATALKNPWGTAPGLWLEGPPGVVVMLPGVPREMRGLLETELVPRLANRLRAGAGGETVTRSRVLRTTGIPESSLAEGLAAVDEQIAPLTLAYLPTLEGVDLRLTAWQVPDSQAESLLERAVSLVRPLLGAQYYGDGEVDLAAVLLEDLSRAGRRLAVAESCTGGLVGQRITAIPGSSAVFVGGVVAYSDRVKERLLGVPAAVIDEHGAVSAPVARLMAKGVTKLLGATAAVAVTGIAGPEGGTPEKPVGTVVVAAMVDESERVVKLTLPGERDAVRRRSAQAALDILRHLMGNPGQSAQRVAE